MLTYKSVRVTRCVLVSYHIYKLPDASWQSDVTPETIMKKVEASSGAKYTRKGGEQEERKYMPKITPASSGYTPVGKVDMAALKSAKPAPSPAAAAPRPAVSTSGGAGSLYGVRSPAVRIFSSPLIWLICLTEVDRWLLLLKHHSPHRPLLRHAQLQPLPVVLDLCME